MLGCGGGAESDTSGALTMTAPAATDNSDGTYTVSTKISYAPPAGKNAQGLQVVVTATDSVGTVIAPLTHTFTSGSNSFDYSISGIPQRTGASNNVRIVVAIGGMTASGSVIVPAVTVTALTVPSATASFALTDPANTVKYIAFTGGTGPYTTVSTVPADIDSRIYSTLIFSSGGTIEVKLLNANVGGVASTATVTLTDSAGGSVPITVNYFK